MKGGGGPAGVPESSGRAEDVFYGTKDLEHEADVYIYIYALYLHVIMAQFNIYIYAL